MVTSVSGSIHNHGKRLVLLFLLIGTVVIALVEYDHLSDGPIVRELNSFFYDVSLRYLGEKKVSKEIVIIDIDERSLSQIGQWPWPRYRLAQLLREASTMQPAAIGVDILMPEPDRTSLHSIRQTMFRDFQVDIAFAGVPPELYDSDELLGNVIRTTPTVLSIYFLFDHRTIEPCTMAEVEVADSDNLLQLYDAPGILCNTDKLTSNDNFCGFINTLDDEDGLLRRLPMLIEYGGRVYTSLALTTVMKAMNIDEIAVKNDYFGIRAMVGSREMILDTDGTMLLPYPGPAYEYEYISAVDILNNKIEAGKLKDKIIFIGSSAAGLYDFHHTIFDPNYPGVETLAVAAGTILEGNIIREPLWAGLLSIVLSLLSVVTVCYIFVKVDKPMQAFVCTLLFLLLLLGLVVTAFRYFHLTLPLGAPVITVCILFALLSLARYSVERRMSFLWFQKMVKSQRVALETMTMVAETRDYETGGHIRRTQHIVRVIAEQLAAVGLYRSILTPGFIELLFVSAPLHDIGKVGVPDSILLKPGALSKEEFEEMKKHTEYGRQILINSGERLADDNFLDLACQIAESHHEKWDGTGYPLGLAGEMIPLSGRIMMLADVYDALTSKRCYKPAYSHKHACEILREGRGTFFDPAVLDAFFAREDDIIAISEKIEDRDISEQAILATGMG